MQCLGFLREGLYHFFSHPLFLEEREFCPFLWWLVPHKENVQPIQWSHTLPTRGSGRMCSSPLYGPKVDHVLLAKPVIIDNGTSSWTFSQACWSKPISLNQYMGTLLALGLVYFLASRNIETLLTYLWFCAISPMAEQGSLWRTISKGPDFELQGSFTFKQLAYTCYPPPWPLSSDKSLPFCFSISMALNFSLFYL